jgi:lipoate-protein ligase A
MAIDEAILRARIDGKVQNTLRLYRWLPSAVSIGRFQSVEREVNLENCRLHGVDVVRRISGGGAVYHDSHDEITYSVVVKQSNLMTSDIAEGYRKICDGLIEAAGIIGVKAEYSKGKARQCPNVTIGGRKISGSSQAHKKGVILQHGTFLLNVDLKKMFMFLKAPRKSACVDLARVTDTRITSFAQEIGRRITAEQACRALIDGFEQALCIRLSKGHLTDYELELAKRSQRDKFAHDEWNLKGKALSSLEPIS